MEGARLLVRVDCKRVMDLPRVRVRTLRNNVNMALQTFSMKHTSWLFLIFN